MDAFFFLNSPTDFKKQKLNDGDLNMLGESNVFFPIMLFYYILLLDHLNDSSRIISLDVMKNRFGFYDVIKK